MTIFLALVLEAAMVFVVHEVVLELEQQEQKTFPNRWTSELLKLFPLHWPQRGLPKDQKLLRFHGQYGKWTLG